MNKFLQLCFDNLAAVGAPKHEAFVSNAAGQTLYIRGVIAEGFEANAADVIAYLNKADPSQPLNIRFNTPGGDVFVGKEISAAIKNYPGQTIAHIDSLCASAGTSIALSCDEVEMSKGAFFMIHNAHGLAFGDKTALRNRADVMEKVELSIVDDYTTKTGKPAEEIIAMMEAETWMDSDEALEHGFIDRVAEAPSKTTNAWNLAAYAKAPTALTAAPPTLAVHANAVIDSAPPARKAAAALKNAVTLNDAESEFLEAMIPHHQSAIDMVKSALPALESDSMVEFAEKILEAQAGEVALMEMWLGVDGGTENKKKMPMKMQAEPAAQVAAIPSMTQSNANRLALITAL